MTASEAVRRPHDDAAWRQTVSKMDMTVLKPFMCPKSRGNPLTCMNCDGRKDCPVGQRAVALLDEQTKPAKYVQAWKEGDPPRTLPNPPPPSATLEKDQAEFRKACESGNAWNWLMTEKGVSKGSAREKLVFWISHYPNIAREFGGKKRIMAEPRTVSIVSAAEKPQDAPEEAPEAEKEQTPAPEEKGPEGAENGRKPEEAIQARVSAVATNARKRCEEAVASGDCRKWLEDRGYNEHNITNTVSRWRKNYPDLMADVPRLPLGKKTDTANDIRHRKSMDFYAECMKQEDPVGYYAEKRNINRKAAASNLRVMKRNYEEDAAQREPEERKEPEFALEDTDKISLLDFLAGFDEAEADRREAETQPEEMPVMQTAEKPPEPDEPPEPVIIPETWKGPELSDADLTDPLVHLKHRAKHLDQEKARMMEIIRQARERIEWIDGQLEPLLKVIANW